MKNQACRSNTFSDLLVSVLSFASFPLFLCPLAVFSTYNWDALAYTSVSDALPELLGPKRVVISKVSNLADEDDPVSVAESFAAVDYIKDFIKEGDDPSEPFSVITFPMIDDAADYVSLFDEETGEPNGNHTVVGLFTMMFFWRDLIRDILPVGSDGTVCVFENACNQTFTYEIYGPDVRYLGRDDLHDPQYEHMGVSLKFSDLAETSANGRQYTGLPLGGELCPYTLRVYPSTTLEEDHTTNNPVIFTISAVLIFVFTSAVFLIYDVCVERRQRKVMNTALQSTANVSLLERMVKERTRKLEEANARLEEANRRVTRASAAQLEHFACMSHEIRTPLNCIIGLSSLLLDTCLGPMQEESMRMIVSSGDLLLTVVNDVLDYSKLESGNVDIQLVRSNLQDTLNAVVRSIEAKARPKNLSIRTLYDPAIGEFVLMDCRRLQQILYNLLGNAIKFSYTGGTIDLSVSLVLRSAACGATADVRGHTYSTNKINEELRTESGLVYASTDGQGGVTGSESPKQRSSSFKMTTIPTPDEPLPNASNAMASTDKMIRFVVRDTGKGIERKDFEAIFLPFRQASAETERVYGGTGLGLAVTAKLATSLGGSISVDSCEGEWSEFTVDLPFQNEPVDIDVLARKLRNTTILLIDDDSANVSDVAHVFRQCQLDFFNYASMGEMVSSVEKTEFLQPSRSYICLVHEGLYEATSYQTLAKAAKTVLLTYGPKYAVKGSKCHYQSLLQVLPSVLMESLCSLVQSLPTAPLQSGTATPRSSRNFASDVPVENRRILIAEDNKINQKVLLRILQRLGFENVDIVDDGKQACDIELQKAFDIILMDIQMPFMSGIEACKEILRRKSGHPKPKIIFVTAHVSDVSEAECRAAGGVDFLPKPFNISDIGNCLQRNTQQHAFGVQDNASDNEGLSERIGM
jgi:signal transduction histidine kinase/CheY-like chemotaxis protein